VFSKNVETGELPREIFNNTKPKAFFSEIQKKNKTRGRSVAVVHQKTNEKLHLVGWVGGSEFFPGLKNMKVVSGSP